MADVIIKRIDAQGRISLPVDWRRNWKSNKVVLTRRGSSIQVSPIEPLNPSELFDSIEVPAEVDISDSHALRKGLLEMSER